MDADGLDRQSEELMVLQSIYGLPDECCTYKVDGCKFMQSYASQDVPSTLNAVDISLADTIYDECPLTLSFVMPIDYPNVKPIVSIKHPPLPADYEDAILAAANNSCDTRIGNECLLPTIQEVKKVAINLFASRSNTSKTSHSPAITDSSSEDDTSDSGDEDVEIEEINWPLSRWTANTLPVLGRRVCYSHHILASSKRRCVIEWAVALRLGGFSKIGHPGIIIVEGPEASCYEYVNRLQRLRWKHFVCRGEEIVEGKLGETVDSLRLLPMGFTELQSNELGLLAEYCKSVGLGNLFMTCMKKYNCDDSTGRSNTTASNEKGEPAKKLKKNKKFNTNMRRK